MWLQKKIIFFKEFISNFFSKGHQRSVTAKKNIAVAIIIKGISIFISLLIVPLTINYVNDSNYGVWLTLSSMIAWISFFDIGFTHGLRNKFAAAKAKGDILAAKTYISTAYYYIGFIFISVWIFLLLVNRLINWHTLINLPVEMEGEISKLAIVVFTYFSFQFILRIINTILTADQQPAKASAIDMLGQLLSLFIIFILTKTTKGSLLYLGLAAGASPVIILIGANLFFFKKKYKAYRPSLKFVKKEYAADIMKLGGKFFVLQISSIIQFETSLFLIAHYINTAEVTAYNIAYRYFFTLQMGFSILLSPLWSGITDAYSKGDILWIKNAVKKYLLLLIPFFVVGMIMLLFSNTIYELWVGKSVKHIDFSISLLCFIFFSTGMFASIFIAVINGIGALRIVFIGSIFTSIGFICLSLLLIKYFNLGVQALLIASIASNVFGYIIAPIQVYKIFYQKSDLKIWYK